MKKLLLFLFLTAFVALNAQKDTGTQMCPMHGSQKRGGMCCEMDKGMCSPSGCAGMQSGCPHMGNMPMDHRRHGGMGSMCQCPQMGKMPQDHMGHGGMGPADHCMHNGETNCQCMGVGAHKKGGGVYKGRKGKWVAGFILKFFILLGILGLLGAFIFGIVSSVIRRKRRSQLERRVKGAEFISSMTNYIDYQLLLTNLPATEISRMKADAISKLMQLKSEVSRTQSMIAAFSYGFYQSSLNLVREATESEVQLTALVYAQGKTEDELNKEMETLKVHLKEILSDVQKMTVNLVR